MSEKFEEVARIDVQQLQKAEKLDNGFLKAPVFATRSGVFKYVRADGSILREYRPPEEVFDEASMKTLAGVPFTNRHPRELVNSKNARKYSIGHVSDIVERDGDFLKTSVTVIHDGTIDEIENKGLREVSCGYKADLEFTSGTSPEGEKYDAIQRRIRYNHLSAVNRGRAGRNVKLVLDSNEAIHFDGIDLLNNPEPTHREDIMAKVTMNGAEFEVEAGIANAINTALETAKKDGASTALESIKTDHQTKLDEQQAKIDSLTSDLEKVKADSIDEAKIQEIVAQRTTLMDSAKPFLKEDADLSKMSEVEIKSAVVMSVCKDADLTEKSEAYIQARYDHILETEKPASKVTKKDSDLKKVIKDINNNDDDKLDSDQTRAKNMITDSELYLKPIGGAAVKTHMGGEA